ncbi:hypothetical protein HYT01_04300 [Candidatus Giovannonibacteria bacterium]|nr:hypothetical protein [Candidatus Giovannonibacteria bacterium]
MTTTKKWTIAVLAVVFVFGVGLLNQLREKETAPGKLDEFAKCLESKQIFFYGAFWCPHCQNQKKMFGSSTKYLPYIECSALDGKSQLPVCKAANITGYPTWVFADGSRESGEVPLEKLAEKSGCALPQ